MTTDTPPSPAVRTPGRNTRTELLGIYLNDHLSAATAGAERARYMAGSLHGSVLGAAVEPVAAEIAEDRAALLDVMRRLDVPVRRYKVLAGRLGERLGRLKANGHLVRRSPLSSVLELEALRLGVEAKASAWRLLRLLAESDERLEARRFDELLERATRQLSTLEALRVQQSRTTFRSA
jgi:hypothetical protein